MKKGFMAALVAASLCPSVAFSTDLFVTWSFSIAGDLSAGASVVLFGSVILGPDRIFDVDANILAPDAYVGNGTDRAQGTLTIICDISAPEPYVIDRITVDLLGSLIPGPFAQNPRIEWTELIFDMATGEPVLIIADSGVDFEQPTTRWYEIPSLSKIRVQETFFLTGVTYWEDDELKIDQAAVSSLTLVQKHVRVVPEPSQLAMVMSSLGALLALRRRR